MPINPALIEALERVASRAGRRLENGDRLEKGIARPGVMALKRADKIIEEHPTEGGAAPPAKGSKGSNKIVEILDEHGNPIPEDQWPKWAKRKKGKTPKALRGVKKTWKRYKKAWKKNPAGMALTHGGLLLPAAAYYYYDEDGNERDHTMDLRGPFGSDDE